MGDYDAIVVGAGFAGAVCARELAQRGDMRVLLLESRDHIAGNAFDRYDDAGVLIHVYGPHIFHSNIERVFSYLTRFTDWLDYSHEVLANLNGTYIPVPFNKNSMRTVFEPDKAEALIFKLIDVFGDERKVTINELRAQSDPDLAEVADFVYENVFLHYTMKQWGQTPEQVDPSVVARVPVFISQDNRYFQDAYQGMPSGGYTQMFKRILDHPGIEVRLGVDARDVLEFREEGGKVCEIAYQGKGFRGPVVYSGPLDELFGCRFGRLPYRSLRFEFETLDIQQFQPRATINYTVSQDYTRITEYKLLNMQDIPGKTTIMREYPLEYTAEPGQIPYYAILNDENRALHSRYVELMSDCPAFYPLGRLAEYKYYNMDAICNRALELADELLS